MSERYIQTLTVNYVLYGKNVNITVKMEMKGKDNINLSFAKETETVETELCELTGISLDIVNKATYKYFTDNLQPWNSEETRVIPPDPDVMDIINRLYKMTERLRSLTKGFGVLIREN